MLILLHRVGPVERDHEQLSRAADKHDDCQSLECTPTEVSSTFECAITHLFRCQYANEHTHASIEVSTFLLLV
jgi:hypothetical protein